MSESRKPDLVLKGKEIILSIWISGKNVKLSISKRIEQGFQKVDSFSIPLDVLIVRAMFNTDSKMTLRQYCELIESIGEEEEGKE